MLNISRDKVPIMETLRALVDMLAGWKINQIQFYTEHTFAYRDYPEGWANATSRPYDPIYSGAFSTALNCWQGYHTL